MIESITATGRTDSHRGPRKKKPNPCVPSQPSLNPCGSPPRLRMHTHAGLAQLASQPGKARREVRKVERRWLPQQLPGISCLHPCRAVPREEPAGKDSTKATAAVGQRTRLLSLTLTASHGEAAHVPDAVPAMSLTPPVRWAYSAGGFLRHPD